MKYGFDGIEDSELIKGYRSQEDKIVISFLDGTDYEVALTEENEKRILNYMLKQAKMRSESDALIDAEKERCIFFGATGVSLAMLLSDLYVYLSVENDVLRTLTIAAGGVLGIAFVWGGAIYKTTLDKISELKKYDIYLSKKQKIEESADPNIFNGIKSTAATLNINTLDKFSRKDLETLRRNIRKSESLMDKFTYRMTK